VAESLQIQEIRYFRLVKPPTLRQFLHRKAVADVMQKVKGETGTGFDPETKRITPLSAIKAKEMLRGMKAEDLMKSKPEWVEEYRRKYGNKD